MKVILLKNDKKLGNENDIIEVADGYATNVLIPKKIAVKATKENIAHRDSRVSSERYHHELKVQCAKKDRQLLDELGTLTIKIPCSKDGKMFGSITNKDISLSLKEKGIEVDKHNIALPSKVIRTTGLYPADISLFEDISFVLPVCIEKE